jgi:hypothetical protein
MRQTSVFPRTGRICWSAITPDGTRQIAGIVLSTSLPDAMADAQSVLYRCAGRGEFQVSFTDHEGRALGEWFLRALGSPGEG